MSITILIISLIQIIGVILHHIMSSFIPAWSISLMFGLISLVLLFTHKGKYLFSKPLSIGIITTSIGLSLLMIDGPVIRYFGYSITILGLLMIIYANNINQSKMNYGRQVLIIIASITLMSFLSFVVIPPPPINIPALFSFMIAGIIICALVFTFIGPLNLINILIMILLTASFLFTGLEVILRTSTSNSILVIIMQAPLHLGLIALLGVHLVMNLNNYELKNKTHHS